MQIFDINTIILIVVAVAVLLKLRSVLGQRSGHQEPPDYLKEIRRQTSEKKQDDTAPGNVVKLPTRGDLDVEEKNPRLAEIEKIAKPRTKLSNGLKAILKSDPNFSPKEFIGGADMAYEMIVDAFASGDKETLQNLLSSEVFEGFASVIDDRESRGETVNSKFIGIDSSEITAAEAKDGEAHVTVKFRSQIVSSTHDKDGKVIEGDESDIATVKDIWTFSRDMKSRDPNWKLVATEAES